jgi:monoamine oxidase
LPHTVVIGGGICGLAAGLTLAERGQQVTVLEAQDFLGGLATTLRGTTGAGFDFGPHAYHARNQRVLDLFKEIAYDGFPARAKNVRIKFRGKYYKYPLEALDIAKSMSPFLAARAFADYSMGHPAEPARGVVRAAPHPAHLAHEGHHLLPAEGPREDHRVRAPLRAARHRALLPAQRRGPHQRPHGRAHQEGGS